MSTERPVPMAPEVIDAGTDAFFDRMQPLLGARPADALRIATDEQHRADALGDRLAVVRALLVQGMARSALGHPERDETLARALALAQAEAEPLTLVRATNAQIVVDVLSGRYADALWRGQEVLGMAHALRRTDLLWRLTLNIGSALSLIGEYEMAIGMYRECLDLLKGESEEIRQQRHQTINNMAWSWMGVARIATLEDNPAVAREALGVARRFAQGACEGSLAEPNGWLRASSLDTFVGVLLELGEVDEAARWVHRVGEQSPGLLVRGTSIWGIFTLARCRVLLATGTAALDEVLSDLHGVEQMPGPLFKSGDMHASLHRCLCDVLARAGRHREALVHRGKWLQFEARTQSLLAREHAMAVQRTLDTLRGETEEFITHDLRNPLGAARVQLGVLDGGWVEPARRIDAMLQQATQAADHYLVILRTRHLRRAALQPLELAELVDDAAEQLAPPADTGRRLARDLDWGVVVRGDRIALLQALQALLRLALAAQGAREVHISLRCSGGVATVGIAAVDDGWARSLDELLRAGGAGDGHSAEGLRAWMVARVARLHDARVEVQADATDGLARVSWHFPLADPAR
ncbi:hypothetical protein [Ideonella sp.]|uniref:hypothetical protein n=1 Tax=Ideonella sp. TaxID=1929293 RepID=UPI0035ADB360